MNVWGKHGKDKKSLKFGFNVKLDPKQIEKIDHYLKHNNIFKKADFIEFSKGDSHQMLFDYSTSQDFDYMNYPAISPSSEWVQNNFKKGVRGFIIQHITEGDKNVTVIPRLIWQHHKTTLHIILTSTPTTENIV